MRYFIRFSAVLLLAAVAAAQENKLKVYIAADMEGIGGVSTWEVQADARGREYEKFRQLMTQEVNAAVAGAFDAGASEVLVSDSHGDAQNIDVEALDKRARLVRAWPRPLLMMQGIDSTFGAAVLIGYYASQGQFPAILAHNLNSQRLMAVKFNGNSMPDAGLAAAIAGDFGVPVVLVSGDQTFGEEMKRLLGPIETVTVKQAIGFYAATMMHPEAAQHEIREGVKRALQRRGEIKPFRLTHPVKLEVTFKQTVNAEVVSYLPGVERLTGDTIAFTGRDMSEVSRFLSAIMFVSAF
ncbi:Peptidase M55 D-aminopeptidase [Candidatus Sulfotelmatobacter kueseliae]|uniref:Peptidase M55 D-aminopeptidase n=1 Tax=Candidatus Sulfotelmatobacter kueseliae TaxID=2042962 RepID=A0A2U3K7G4_9BACT|nr:Peptidase M55 D-aminopeptidase [Candidatus Sulfotelmatobacter kueseliae]